MSNAPKIPAFGLYGEAGQFPDVIHIEGFSARAPVHNWRIPPHRHSQMAQVFVVDDGWMQATAGGRGLTVDPKNFLYIPINYVHDIAFKPGSSGVVISFPASVVTSIAPAHAALDAALAQVATGRVTDALAHALALLKETAHTAAPFRNQQVVGLAHTVLSLIAATQTIGQGTQPTPKPARLFDLDALIARHRADGWTAARYAQALSVTTGHLSRLCRTATGQGATAYIEARVMDEAARLLAFTPLPVSEIGYRLGYLDPSYFSKRFRRVRGQTPTAYREIFAG